MVVPSTATLAQIRLRQAGADVSYAPLTTNQVADGSSVSDLPVQACQRLPQPP
jgi:hypothetical protein